MSELTRRIIFAVIAAPASIAIVYFGDWALAIVLSVLAALAAWELFRMARETGALPLEPAGISNTVRLLSGNTPGKVGAVTVNELRATVWLSTLIYRGVPEPPMTVIGLFTVNVLPTAIMSGTS